MKALLTKQSGVPMVGTPVFCLESVDWAEAAKQHPKQEAITRALQMAFNRLPEEEKPENKAKLGLFDDFGQHKHNLDNSAHKDSVQSDLTCRVKDHVARGYTPRHTKLLCSTVFTATRVLELMKEPSVNSVNCARADSLASRVGFAYTKCFT